MDLGDPLSLFAGLILGISGTGMIIYGKKKQQLVPALAGVVLCVIPYVVASVLVDWLIAIATFGGLIWVSRHA